MRTWERDIADKLDEALGAAPDGSGGERLCLTCAELFDVDGAALSLLLSDVTAGTFAASSRQSRDVDALQFSTGEGPCLDSVASGRPVLVEDLRQADRRWPLFVEGALAQGVSAVFALPVVVGASTVGALDLFRSTPGPLSEHGLWGARRAAELARLPVLDLIGRVESDVAGGGDGSTQLRSLDRAEVHQATGMLMVQLGVDASSAVARLRAHAIAEGRTMSDVAWDVIGRRLTLPRDGDAS